MRLSVKGFALAAGILWGAVMFLTALLNLAFPDYGGLFLEMMASVYPGYEGTTGFVAVVVGTLYGALDGAVVGAVLAWLYNALTPAAAAESVPTI